MQGITREKCYMLLITLCLLLSILKYIQAYLVQTNTLGLPLYRLRHPYSLMQGLLSIHRYSLSTGTISSLTYTVVWDLVGIKRFHWITGIGFASAGIGSIAVLQLIGMLTIICVLVMQHAGIYPLSKMIQWSPSCAILPRI